ncbi:hypothetical protein ONZ45_g13355 [Pleurotus djamor]|nr:hypothetical protein ONZ45_g13355 [Pleurotus djamor]
MTRPSSGFNLSPTLNLLNRSSQYLSLVTGGLLDANGTALTLEFSCTELFAANLIWNSTTDNIRQQQRPNDDDTSGWRMVDGTIFPCSPYEGSYAHHAVEQPSDPAILQLQASHSRDGRSEDATFGDDEDGSAVVTEISSSEARAIPSFAAVGRGSSQREDVDSYYCQINATAQPTSRDDG